MSTYTELIFGATLKATTPIKVIDTLRFMVGKIREPRKLEYHGMIDPFENGGATMLRNAYGEWELYSRSKMVNYGCDIEGFLEFILPYIESGSGARDMYAIVLHEDADEPKIYYLK